jgi:hypothetical protein
MIQDIPPYMIPMTVILALVVGTGLFAYQFLKSSPAPQELTRILVTVFAILGTAAFAVIFLYGSVVSMMTQGWTLEIAQKHFAASVGLPFAALAPLCLVSVLKIRSGPIELEAWGLKFKGAATPIVFWMLIFLAIASSIKMLWNLQ